MQKSVLGKLWQPVTIQEDLVTRISRELRSEIFWQNWSQTRVSSAAEAFDFLDPKIKRLLPGSFSSA